MVRRALVVVIVVVAAALAFLFFAPVVPYQRLQNVEVTDNASLCSSPSSTQCSLSFKQVWVGSYGSFVYDAFGIGNSPFASPVRTTTNGVTTVLVFNSTGFVVEQTTIPSFVESEPVPLISVAGVKTLTLPFGGTGVSVELVNNGSNETAYVNVGLPGSILGYSQAINSGQSVVYNITSWQVSPPKPGDSLRLLMEGSVCYGEICMWYQNNVASTVEPAPAAKGSPQSIAGGTAGSVWLVGAMSTDASALGNTGVRSILQVISARPAGSLAFWIGDDLTNNVWGQVGYVSTGGAPVAFYQVWNLTSDTNLARGTTTVGTGNHTFSMYLQNGTTWAYAVDGVVFGTYNMRSASSSLTYPVYTLSEEQANNTFSFPSVYFSSVMQVLKSGAWNPVVKAVSYGSALGLQGNLQNDELSADQMIVGGNLAGIPQGTALWAGCGSLTSSSVSPLDPSRDTRLDSGMVSEGSSLAKPCLIQSADLMTPRPPGQVEGT